MITLNAKQTIIKHHLEGISKRQIAKKVNKSRNTVSKYIKEFEMSRHKDIRNLPITEDIMKTPVYKKRNSQQPILTEQIKNKLRGYIKENTWKRKHYMGKQQMKIIDMHEELIDSDFSISYTTVRNYVNKEIDKTKEVFIRRHCEPGYEVEFDWGEIKLNINGKIRSYSLAVFTLAYSNYRFARIYESESQVCVLDVHTQFIDEIDFIPTVFTYDNMRTVVKSFIGNEKTITNAMTNISNYYQFKIRLCGTRKGNEKGHVERSVEFIRRKAFASIFSFTDLQEAENHLYETLHKINKRKHYEHKEKHLELMKKEKAISKPAIAPFDGSEMIECRVNKYSTVVISQNHYSVPEGYVGKYIKAKVGARHIKLFIDGELMADHIRNWGLHQWVMDINHYLETFEKKKGALSQSECLRQAPTQIKKIFHTHYIGNEKEFLELLLYINKNNNLKSVLNAVEQLENIRQGYVTTDQILFICEQSFPTESYIFSPDEATNQSESNMKAYADMFNQIDEGVTHE